MCINGRDKYSLTDCSQEGDGVEHPPGEGPLPRMAADSGLPRLRLLMALLLLEFLQVCGLAGCEFLHEGLRQLVLISQRRENINSRLPSFLPPFFAAAHVRRNFASPRINS